MPEAPLKLAHATPAQQNAAFNYLYPKLEALVQEYVPSIFQWQIQQKLQSPSTRQQIYQILDGTLDAALNAQETST